MATENPISIDWAAICRPCELDSFASMLKDKGGVYLWIFNSTVKERVTYIGEASNFLPRFIQHLSMQQSGGYNAYAIRTCDDPLEFWRRHIINNEWKPGNNDRIYIPRKYWERDNYFFDRFFDSRRRRLYDDYLEAHSFAFGIMGESKDRGDVFRTNRKNVESVLMKGFRSAYSDEMGLKNPEDFRFVDAYRNHSIIGGITQAAVGSGSIRHGGVALSQIPAPVRGVMESLTQWHNPIMPVST